MNKYRDYLFRIAEVEGGDFEDVAGEEFAVEIISSGDDKADMEMAMAEAEAVFPGEWIFEGEVDPYLVEMYGIDTY